MRITMHAARLPCAFRGDASKISKNIVRMGRV
jgi:hypothetical protein